MRGVSSAPDEAPVQQLPPNCTADDKDTVDRAGLRHAWKLVDDSRGDTYVCARCGCVDYD